MQRSLWQLRDPTKLLLWADRGCFMPAADGLTMRGDETQTGQINQLREPIGMGKFDGKILTV
jgi:hypothetical protein